jgi:uncharacterized DUF497 family protein
VKEPVLDFEWDAANVAHIARHGVTAGEAEQVMENDPADVGYDVVEGEPRWTVVGHTKSIRVLVVVWTFRNGKLRVVTAREAAKRLREDYFRVKRVL